MKKNIYIYCLALAVALVAGMQSTVFAQNCLPLNTSVYVDRYDPFTGTYAEFAVKGISIRAAYNDMKITAIGYVNGEYPDTTNAIIEHINITAAQYTLYERDTFFTAFENLTNFEIISHADNPTDEFCLQSIQYTGCEVLVTLSYFAADPADAQVVLRWETESEVENAGFNIYRSESIDGPFTQINESLIPAQGTPTEGAFYEFTDTDVQNRKTYYYKLEDIDFSGESAVHGPEKATPLLIYRLFK